MRVTDKHLAAQVFRLTNKIIFLEKKSLLRREGVTLFPSEIHLLDVIDRRPDINASEMAAKLGVTKGAISQTLTRLEKKGILVKTKDPQNKNELTVHFTSLGNEINEEQRKMRSQREIRFVESLAGVSDAEKEVIGRFLVRLGDFFDGLG